MSLFDAKLVSKRWTADYYQTLSMVRFTYPSWNDGNENSDVSVSVISSEPIKARIVTQKHRNLLKIANPLASVEIEHEMKIYNEKVLLLGKDLEN